MNLTTILGAAPFAKELAAGAQQFGQQLAPKAPLDLSKESEVYGMIPDWDKDRFLSSIPDDDFAPAIPKAADIKLQSIINKGGIIPHASGLMPDIMASIRNGLDYKPGASAAIYQQHNYEPIGVTKWDSRAKKIYNRHLPVPYEDEENPYYQKPEDREIRDYMEAETGVPDLSYFQNVEKAGDAYDADPSSKNLVSLQLALREYDVARKRVARYLKGTREAY